ncbi:Ulp1 family isopeptidase [Chlamydia suis]|uniref:Ulp1 family isopeptidase n=1 Tax=Chlamydia suis TaxID=83559 RepID=UPI0009B05D6F|nr:Ulp1 family isopeptidase [Chlamydia suis]
MQITSNQPQQKSYPSSPENPCSKNIHTSFKDAPLAVKITRVVLAIFLVIFSCGLILCAYSFRDLLDIDCTSQHPSQQVGNLLQHLDDFVAGPLPIWDNTQLFQFSCLMHERHPHVLPIDICSPVTKFNCNEHICSTILSKQLLKGTGDCNGFCPPTCAPENYQWLLSGATLFPFILWHDPSAPTQEAMLAKMDQMISSGRVGNSHWILVLVDLSRRSIVFFDSLYNYMDSPQNVQSQLEELADSLGNIYPPEECSCEEALLSPFQINIVSITMKVQTPGEFSCGAWCCRVLQWYLENPEFSLEEKVSQDVSQRKTQLAQFIRSSQEGMSKYSSLSWPSL